MSTNNEDIEIIRCKLCLQIVKEGEYIKLPILINEGGLYLPKDSEICNISENNLQNCFEFISSSVNKILEDIKNNITCYHCFEIIEKSEIGFVPLFTKYFEEIPLHYICKKCISEGNMKKKCSYTRRCKNKHVLAPLNDGQFICLFCIKKYSKLNEIREYLNKNLFFFTE